MINDAQWPIAPNPNQLPPGKYTVAFIRAHIVERFSRNNIELVFRIVKPQEWADTTVKKFYALPAEVREGSNRNIIKTGVAPAAARLNVATG